MRLNQQFYLNNDTVSISQLLLGKIFCTKINGEVCKGFIVETEAYRGADDKASHAYPNKRTKRTQIMFEKGGLAYIYLCYGIHHMFNIVTGDQNIANATLIRAIEPIKGIQTMMERRGKKRLAYNLTKGPGSTGKAMGCHVAHTGEKLYQKNSKIWIEENPNLSHFVVESGTRIGVDYADECCLYPWRFWIKNNPWVSKLKS